MTVSLDRGTCLYAVIPQKISSPMTRYRSTGQVPRLRAALEQPSVGCTYCPSVLSCWLLHERWPRATMLAAVSSQVFSSRPCILFGETTRGSEVRDDCSILLVDQYVDLHVGLRLPSVYTITTISRPTDLRSPWYIGGSRV